VRIDSFPNKLALTVFYTLASALNPFFFPLYFGYKNEAQGISLNKQSFLSPVDSLYSFYPRREFWQYFLSLDPNSFMMGALDSNWSFLFKDLPLYILNFFVPSMGISITAYLIVINLIGFRIIHITLKSICKDLPIIRLILAILWILGPQFQQWSWSAPNVQLYYAFFPLPLYYLIKYFKENNNCQFYLAVVYSVTIGIFDPSYGFIGIIAYNSIFIFILVSHGAVHTLLYLKGIALGIFICIFNYSGIISPLILGTFSTGYEVGAIAETRDIEIIRSTIESANLIPTLFGHFGNVKFNNLGINLPPFLLYWQVILITVITFIMISNRKYRLFAPIFIFATMMVMGKNLPYFTGFYEVVFSIPGTVLFRNIFKWNIIVYLTFLISCLYVIKYLVVDKNNFSTSVSKVKIIALCFILLFPISFTSILYLNSISQKGHLSHVVLPNEYFQLKEYLNQKAKGFRVYYLPLNNWTVPERYVWSKAYENAPINPFIGSLVEAPNNLRPTITQHELTIGLKNLIYIDQISIDDKLIFFENLGFKYIILRSDRLEEPQSEAKDEFKLWTSDLLNSRANLVFKNKTFSVYELNADPIVRTTPTMNIKHAFNSLNIVHVNRQSYPIVKIENSLTRSAHSILFVPIIESKLGDYLFIKSPMIFGRIDSSNIEVCQNEKIENTLTKLTNLQYIGNQEIGNCYEIRSKSRNYLIIPASDLLSLYIKVLMGFIISLNLVRLVMQNHRFK
jgi:hypothetical protein